MLRLAPALLILLAGCTGLVDERDPGPAEDATPSVSVDPRVPIIALISEYEGTATVVVEVRQTTAAPAPRQVYQAIRPEPVTTPPASMDPLCGDAPKELRVSAQDALNSRGLGAQTVPYACGPEWFIIFIDNDGSLTAAPLEAWGAEMPSTWKRGDPWPWDDDPADEEPQGQGPVQPAISWSVSQADVSASVTSADPGANWAEFAMRLDRAGQLDQNGDITLDMPAGTFVQLDAAPIGGGDVLRFCIDGADGPLKATLRHIESNSVAREFVFNTAGAC